MVRKKLDTRIRSLLENAHKLNHRSMLVLIGDKGREQIPNLHYILSKSSARRPKVLWCYKDELGFASDKSKRAKKLKKDIARGLRVDNEEAVDPFELFLTSTHIKYVYYKDSHRVLGQTVQMIILQDFEALTPNLLARTIETVSGGGLIVLLLKTMTSLKQLYSLSMDVHSRYRTAQFDTVVPRFNERFILSLGMCHACVVLDDELNILPISSTVRTIKKMTFDAKQLDPKTDQVISRSASELKALQVSLQDTEPACTLINLCKTLDQAKAVLSFIEAIADKSLRSTVSLTAGRGRGKSAALGISIGAAIAYGYSNIFITSPNYSNVSFLFEMILTTFDALNYKEHIDYDLIRYDNNTDSNSGGDRAGGGIDRADRGGEGIDRGVMKNGVMRINVFHSHRQTIQYISPQDAHLLSQAELLVIDECAAIPIEMVKRLLGNYLCFLSSTIHGYEGTGRALSLKLLKKLRNDSAGSSAITNQNKQSGYVPSGSTKRQRKTANANSGASSSASTASMVDVKDSSGRVLNEITLSEPIRYGLDDPIEEWLNSLLCLNAASDSQSTRLLGGVPHPDSCTLYQVNRDTLFSMHQASESFLNKTMSLFVASHYKNSPNDLQLLSDAPAHRLFVLLGPVLDASTIPDILCVVQVAIEGQLSKDMLKQSLTRGIQKAGDLIPWTMSVQFQNSEFSQLSGVRIVRIATHPDVNRYGYGTKALNLLREFYSGNMVNLNEEASFSSSSTKANNKNKNQQGGEKKKATMSLSDGKTSSSSSLSSASSLSASSSMLLTEKLSVSAHTKPLLIHLNSIKPERIDWLGTSFGLTEPLFGFWNKNGFECVYIRQTKNTLTGEHTTIMLSQLHHDRSTVISSSEGDSTASSSWLASFHADFLRRMTSLTSIAFTQFPVSLCLAVLQSRNNQNKKQNSAARITSSSSMSSSSSGAGGASGGGAALLSCSELQYLFTSYDLHRLESYARNLVDYHLIVDLIPTLSTLYFTYRLDIHLSYVQAAILLGIGLQRKTITQLEGELQIASSQILALFNKAIRKLSTVLNKIYADGVKAELMQETKKKTKTKKKKTGEENAAEESSSSSDDDQDMPTLPVRSTQTSVTQELNAMTKEALIAEKKKKKKQKTEDKNTTQKILENQLRKYAIAGDDSAWSKALSTSNNKKNSATAVASISVATDVNIADERRKANGKRERERENAKKSKKKSKKHKKMKQR